MSLNNIIVIARTRDEEYNIERFCRSYQWADKILIADGGSEDNTVSLAKKFPNVSVRTFTERVWKGRVWRNPHGKHINFLIDWARDEKADWIIFDDVDCVPNYLLKQNAREILGSCPVDFIFAVRLYLWRKGTYFPKLSIVNNESPKVWTPSLWAWQADLLDFKADESDPWIHAFTMDLAEVMKFELLPPYCLLHDPWPTDKILSRKRDFYNKTKEAGMLHPLSKYFGGIPETLPVWAREDY